MEGVWLWWLGVIHNCCFRGYSFFSLNICRLCIFDFQSNQLIAPNPDKDPIVSSDLLLLALLFASILFFVALLLALGLHFELHFELRPQFLTKTIDRLTFSHQLSIPNSHTGSVNVLPY